MRRGWCLVVVAIIVGGAAEPETAAPETGQLQQTQTENAKRNPNAEQTGGTPMPVIVHVHPAEKTETERAEETRERHEKAELDRQLVELTADLAKFTKGLFAATIALFVATAGLAYFGYRQSKDMRESIAAARQAADAATKSADAALGVELPRFVLDSVSLLVSDDIKAMIRGGLPIVRLRNIGKTAAVVLYDSVEIRRERDLPPIPVFTNKVPVSIGVLIEPDASHNIHREDLARAMGKQDAERLATRQAGFWVFGMIGYRDFLGKVHTKRFCCEAVAYPQRTAKPDGTPIYQVSFAAGGPPQYNSTQYEEDA